MSIVWNTIKTLYIYICCFSNGIFGQTSSTSISNKNAWKIIPNCTDKELKLIKDLSSDFYIDICAPSNIENRLSWNLCSTCRSVFDRIHQEMPRCTQYKESKQQSFVHKDKWHQMIEECYDDFQVPIQRNEIPCTKEEQEKVDLYQLSNTCKSIYSNLTMTTNDCIECDQKFEDIRTLPFCISLNKQTNKQENTKKYIRMKMKECQSLISAPRCQHGDIQLMTKESYESCYEFLNKESSDPCNICFDVINSFDQFPTCYTKTCSLGLNGPSPCILRDTIIKRLSHCEKLKSVYNQGNLINPWTRWKIFWILSIIFGLIVG